MITIDHLSKTFRVHKKKVGFKGSLQSLFHRKWEESAALTDLSLSVRQSEILGLVGENGAGKTTLMKILAGIIHPTSGKVSVLGYNPWQRSNKLRQQMALIMGQKNQLWWDLPAADCFLLLKEIYQIPTAQYKKNMAYLVDTFNIAGKLNVQVRKLSLGERMKMELIATLLHDPKVIFLDEPTIGLDNATQRAVRNFILDYLKEKQPIILLTSHYMADIEHLCKRIAILKQGRLVYDGPRSDISNRYGHSKIIQCHIPRHDQSIALELPEPLKKSILQQTFSKDMLRIEVKKDAVGKITATLLDLLPIEDLSIMDPDIGLIIERIVKEKE